ncbi:MAG: arabinose ABC transporter permease [Gammaproteobacteria bacterium]|nr:arabinose ABC transporter permease [Gammaproteobacteria bacterium]|tara:strand:- start:259 stop:1479 length:1221 start_codon:yes stop_codon:yes gene_type:complete
MPDTARAEGRGFLAAFGSRSYRFQWPADLLSSWAFEMETLILNWFVLVATDSVLMTAAFSALAFGGTLLSPFFGVLADRIDRKTMLITMRLTYLALAATVMTLGLTGNVEPWQLFAIAAVSGLLRPSDLVVRHSLIADTFTAAALPNAMGLSRITMDSARIAGSLLGAGLLSTVGIGVAYGAVVGFYVVSIALATGIAAPRPAVRTDAHPWQDLRLGFRYVFETPTILGIMSLAFLVNLTAFPITHGLLTIVARNVFGLDENGLARLVASYAVGALIGSLILAAYKGSRPGRATVIATLAWYVLLMGFGLTRDPSLGMGLIVFIGAAQSFSMISMSVLLLTTAHEAFRGRVSGVRMLAVYGLPLGLIIGGALIELLGTHVTFTLFTLTGIACTVLIAFRWRVLIES